MATPSACNFQPWRFVVVTNPAVKKAISEQIKPAGPASKAPVVIVVCGDMDNTFESAPDYWAEDCSAATENIMLAAHAMGLGTVWMGIYPQKERYELLKNFLELPDNIKAFGMIAVGHPAEHPAPKDKWDANKVHYEKWYIIAVQKKEICHLMVLFFCRIQNQRSLYQIECKASMCGIKHSIAVQKKKNLQ